MMIEEDFFASPPLPSLVIDHNEPSNAETLSGFELPTMVRPNKPVDEPWNVGLAALASTVETFKKDLTKDLKKEMADQKEINEELKAALAKIQKELTATKTQEPQAADQIGEQAICNMQLLSEIESANGEEHTFKPSAWDACAFIGFGCLSWQDISLAIATTCLNAVLQIVFCLVTYVNMTTPPIDAETVKAVKHWRGVFGHDYAYADKRHQLSLAAQLCGKDPGMVQSASQMELYSAIMDYLQPEDDTLQGLDGRVMCVVATFCWCLLLLEDVRDNMSLQRALYYQPVGKPEIKICADGTYEITTFSQTQKVLFSVCISIPRMFVAIFLGWIGMEFLAYTYNNTDLLLNAIALGFVLDIDEMTFSAFAPKRLQALLSQTAVLKLPERSFGNLDKVVKMVSALAFLLILWFVYLSPFVADMQEVRKYFCDGDTNFLVTVNPGSKDIYSREGSHYADGAFGESYVKTATLALAGLGEPHSLATANISNKPPGMEAIHGLERGSVAHGANQLRCIDHLNETTVLTMYRATSHYHAMRMAMMDQLSEYFDDMTSCDQVVINASNHHTWCMQMNMNSLRSVCPVTCGCDNPWMGNMLATPQNGCPGSCTASYMNNLHGFYNALPKEMLPYVQQKCEDVPKTFLVTSEPWINYCEGVFSMFETLIDSRQGRSVWNLMISKGCEAIPLLAQANVNLCSPNQGGIGRTARPFCPSTCRRVVSTICTDVDQDECPPGCFGVRIENIQADKVSYFDSKSGKKFDINRSSKPSEKSLKSMNQANTDAGDVAGAPKGPPPKGGDQEVAGAPHGQPARGGRR